VTAVETLETTRAAGVDLTPAGANLRFRAPRGALTPELRQALAAAKPELLDILRAERRSRVARVLSDAYGRLNRFGPWTSTDLDPHRELGATVDSACLAYVEGSLQSSAVEAAILNWEAALCVGRTPRPEADPAVKQSGSAGCRRCGPRSVAFLDLDDGARICGRCGAEVTQ
jgi:hypothetical protein